MSEAATPVIVRILDKEYQVACPPGEHAQLIDAGYRRVAIHVEPKLTHSQRSAAEDALLATALKDWGALDAPPPPPPERAPAPPAAERAPAAVAAATTVLAKPSADELVDGIARLDIERQASPES